MTPEERLIRNARRSAERAAHRARVMAKYPPAVRYAKAKFKKGKKHQKKNRQAIHLGVQ